MRDQPVPEHAVEDIPGAVGAAWSRLPGLTGGAWLLRPHRGPGLVVRQASALEVQAALAAAAADVGPPVVATPPGWLVSEHLSGRHVSALELSRPTTLAELAGLLRRWHQCATPSLPEVSLANARAAYLADIPSGALPAGLAVSSARADVVERQLDETAQRRVLAHLDVVANLLATPRGLRLIDFEYAAAADPARELGQVVWEAELDRRGLERLVGEYGADAGVAEAATRDWAWIAGVTWTLWAYSREQTPVMQQYARRSWERIRHHWTCPGV